MYSFVHIAKCGGTTITNILDKIIHEEFHFCQPNHDIFTSKVAICVRNPIERLMSAFYWIQYRLRHPEYMSWEYDKYIKNNPTISQIEKYSDFNDFALSLDNEDKFSKNMIENPGKINGVPCVMGRNIHWYLKNIINEINKDNTVIICLHLLDEDIERHFGMKLNLHEKKNEYHCDLSERAISNLKKYLKNDYKIIDTLYENGVLSSKQYNLLKINKHEIQYNQNIMDKIQELLIRLPTYSVDINNYTPLRPPKVNLKDLECIKAKYGNLDHARDVENNCNRISYLNENTNEITSSIKDELRKLYLNSNVITSGAYMYPPGAYCGWHTNSDLPGMRIYFIWVKEDKKSFFRYVDADDKVMTVWDKKGWNVRSFNINHTPLWHCVYSDTIRISFGFNIFYP